jgi:hypothetical protein
MKELAIGLLTQGTLRKRLAIVVRHREVQALEFGNADHIGIALESKLA